MISDEKRLFDFWTKSGHSGHSERAEGRQETKTDSMMFNHEETIYFDEQNNRSHFLCVQGVVCISIYNIQSPRCITRCWKCHKARK